MRMLLTVFLIGHAAVHAVMWTLPFTDATRDMPFNPGHSWLLGDNRVLAAIVAGVATVAFAVTALGYLIDAGWWPPAMLAAATVSLLLMVGWFTPWWLAGIALSAGLAVYAWQTQPLT